MNIILATDGTRYSEAATQMVKKLTLDQDDTILVVSVVDMAVPMSLDISGGYLPETSSIEETARQHAVEVVESTSSSLRDHFGQNGVAIEVDVLFGSPDSRIVETAEEMRADLIVMGSHGYKAWERVLLGSVSNSVIHHAHCSVLVVREPNAPSE